VLEQDPATTESENDTADIWLLPYEKVLKTSNYQSWNAFEHVKHKESRSAYISEAGEKAFDAALSHGEDYLKVGNTKLALMDSKVFKDSLASLALGRSSVLFAWDEGKHMFRQTEGHMRISGFTRESLLSVTELFSDCGRSTKCLQNFVQASYKKQRSAGRIAFADVLQSILMTIEQELSIRAATYISILQLQALFQPAQKLLLLLTNLAERISLAEDDESMLSVVFHEIQTLDGQDRPVLHVLLEIFSRVSKPWLEFANEWIGVRRNSGLPMSKTGTSKAFVRVESRAWTNEQGEDFEEPDYMLNRDKIPSFLELHDAQLMFEVGKNIRLLRTHHPHHTLSNVDVILAASPPELYFEFDWLNVLDIERKAQKYEQDLRAALNSFLPHFTGHQELHDQASTVAETDTLGVFGKPVEELEAHLLASLEQLDVVPAHHDMSSALSGNLRAYLHCHHEDPKSKGSDMSAALPNVAMLSSLSFNPILAAQARIVNGTLIRLFFKSHNLREHLSIQRQFHLLGNGVFASRLTHALFDPELETTQRQRGVARSGSTMGLRLGGRDTWPPASSELRLALMGVLTEAYTAVSPKNRSKTVTFLDDTSVPGDLSFAVRDMSEEEMQACKNATSLQALDFLRLSYKPPAPLETVITPMILYKYDQIFRLLLRVLRMLYVVSSFFRAPLVLSSTQQDPVLQRFRIEARHFASSVSDYFFESGINATWRIFDRKLDELEARIDDSAYNLRADEGIDNLKEYHEMVLDKMLFALLLRKRQQAVMKLLEEIFDLILRFSEHERQFQMTKLVRSEDRSQVMLLYRTFKQKVTVFVNVCRGMAEKKGYGEMDSTRGKGLGQHSMFDGHDLAEENTIAQLLCRLDMFGYYS